MQHKPMANRVPSASAISDLRSRIYAGVILACVAIGVGMLMTGLNEPLLPPSDVDVGVYWQTLRSMRAGYHLCGQIFHSQAPFFLLPIYPFYASFGSTLESARLGAAVLALLGFAGAYMMGRALGGRTGSIAALAILVVSPTYLAQSQELQAEGPATAFLFLTVGAALLWREHPRGRRGYYLAILSAVALSLGILTKLFDVVAVVPILLTIGAHLWERRQTPSASARADLLPIAAATLAGVVATLVVLAPFAYCFDQLMRQAVMFHLDMRTAINVAPGDNIEVLRHFFAKNAVLSAAALVGAFVAILRRDGRMVPLAAWLLLTLLLLAVHSPLFSRHTIILVPPLIAIVALALNDLPAISLGSPRPWPQKLALLTGVLALAAVLVGIASDYRHHHRNLIAAAESNPQRSIKIAAELERTTTADQWVITDDPFVAGLAGRDVPPWLVDPSFERVLNGYLSTRELIEAGADARVHAVLFATGRLTAAPIASFHDWVAERFQRVDLNGADAGVELWVR
jgi:dolichyl-phosphate-mannose-protein mannosyltransferase